MKRWFFRLAVLFSLIIWIATASLWIRSYFASDRLEWPNPKFQPPPSQPKINFSAEHINFDPGFRARSELEYAGIMVVRANRIVNTAPGMIEFILDSPPWRQIQPRHATFGLPPGRFAGYYSATSPFADIGSAVWTTAWSFLGFSHDEFSGYPPDGIFPPKGSPKTLFIRRWTIPYWPLALLSAILPAIWLRSAMIARRRRSANLCGNCGYDLRATPERCPECGLIASTVKGNAG